MLKTCQTLVSLGKYSIKQIYKPINQERNNTSLSFGLDSGDHLHPSELAYEAMAACVPEELLK